MQVLLLEPDFWRFLGISQILKSEPGLQLIGEHDPQAILSRPPSRDLNPEVIIVSHSLALEEDMSILQRLHSLFPAANILVEGYEEGLETIAEVLRAGASGYFPLSSEPQNLLKALAIVQKGSIWAPREAVVLLARQVPGRTAAGAESVTPLQQSILELLRDGMSNKAISRELGVAEVTVKSHLTKLYRKFGVRTRLGLLTYAITHHLVREQSDTILPRRPH